MFRCVRQFAEVALNGWRHFCQLPKNKPCGLYRRRMTRACLRGVNWTFPNEKQIANSTICISPWGNCDEKIRVFASKVAAESTAQCSDRRGSCSDIFQKKRMKSSWSVISDIDRF